jgi:hypothetical protein
MIASSAVREGPSPRSEGIAPMPTSSVPRAALVLARPRLAVAVAVSGGPLRPGANVDGPDGRPHASSCSCGGELDLCEPDEQEPDRLVGVCIDCDAWIYRVPTGGGRVLALELPGPAAALAATEMCPADSPRGSGPRQPGLMMGRWDTSACISAPLLRQPRGGRSGLVSSDEHPGRERIPCTSPES